MHHSSFITYILGSWTCDVFILISVSPYWHFFTVLYHSCNWVCVFSRPGSGGFLQVQLWSKLWPNSMANQMLAYRRSCREQIIPISDGHRIRRQQQHNAIICWTEALWGLHATFILTDGFVVEEWQHARDRKKRSNFSCYFQKMYRVQCTFSIQCLVDYSWAAVRF